jgi:cGMP-dependent protein kinase
MIFRAITTNDFLKNLEKVQINEIVESMHQKEFKADQYVCREGAIGTELYVISGQP